ncbi:MAG: extracellular solute-binding protein [Bacillales bacterium]|jgi:ABC-type glycerol-3-phosphate transport system substrate-binding protein|nr:extracellular solute-binding protein [Bacillales bacterium]
MKKTRYVTMGILTFLLFSMVSCKVSNKIEVSIGMWPDTASAKDVNMFKNWKMRFEKDHPEYEIIGQNYEYSRDTIFGSSAAHNLPTVFQTWFTEPAMLVENNIIREITPQLDALGWSDKMDLYMKDIVEINDKMYGIPRDGYALGMFINLKLMYDYEILPDENNDKLGDLYDSEGNPLYPQTFEDLEKIGEQLSEIGDVKPIFILSANKNGGWQFTNIAWNFGAELQVQDNEGKYHSNLNSPEVIEAMEWIREMKSNDYLLKSATTNYFEWYSKVGEQTSSAFVGSDQISLAVINGGLEKEEIAFVPMPKGPRGDQYSLFGGTPFVFSKDASDAEVKGALLFLEYMGRSPETSEASRLALKEGNETAKQKGQPILPTIKAWVDADYLQMANDIEEEYVNVNMDNFKDFFNTIDTLKKPEYPNCSQEMYEFLDAVIQAVLLNPDTVNVSSQLISQHNKLEDKLSKL